MKFREFILLFFLFSLPLSAFEDQNLPDIGDSSGSLISPEFDRRLGNAFLREVRRTTKLVYDPEVEAYIDSIGYRLATNSDNNRQLFTFFVIDNPLINAFAGPGGVIGINSGVILSSHSESELAGVIAHEIAHVTQRHLARSFEQASKFSIPTAAALIGAIILGTQNPEAGAAALQATIGISTQAQINFTRANEKEADNIGMQLLVRSGFDPYGMPGFFEKLQQGSKYYSGNAPEFLRTHPLTSSRIAESQARAAEYPRVKPIHSESYHLIRTKLHVHSFAKPKQAITDYLERLQQANSSSDFIIARYGYALALQKDKQFSAAKNQIANLLKNDPHNSSFLLASAKIESDAGNYSSAIKIYKEIVKLYPDYRPLILNYAKTLLDFEKPNEARLVLLEYGHNHASDISYLNLLSQAEAQAGYESESHIVKSEFYYLLGDTELAIRRLRLAEKQKDLDYYQRERIKALLSQYEYERQLEKELEL